MTHLNTVVKFLNNELNINRVHDYSKNGLQVRANKEIKKIGFAVDGALSTFELAKKNKVDLLIVHHGIKWKKDRYPPAAKIREEYCKRNKISLYGVHLPLDLHRIYGNNIQLCKILNLYNIKKFHKHGKEYIGYKGILPKALKINNISSILNKALCTKSKTYQFGKTKIKSIGICSGGGASALEEAVKEKQDCLLTGEIDISAYHRAKDYKINLITAGHYATETVGVKALMPLIQKKFNIPVIFIDNPTGV